MECPDKFRFGNVFVVLFLRIDRLDAPLNIEDEPESDFLGNDLEDNIGDVDDFPWSDNDILSLDFFDGDRTGL